MESIPSSSSKVPLDILPVQTYHLTPMQSPPAELDPSSNLETAMLAQLVPSQKTTDASLAQEENTAQEVLNKLSTALQEHTPTSHLQLPTLLALHALLDHIPPPQDPLNALSAPQEDTLKSLVQQLPLSAKHVSQDLVVWPVVAGATTALSEQPTTLSVVCATHVQQEPTVIQLVHEFAKSALLDTSTLELEIQTALPALQVHAEPPPPNVPIAQLDNTTHTLDSLNACCALLVNSTTELVKQVAINVLQVSAVVLEMELKDKATAQLANLEITPPPKEPTDVFHVHLALLLQITLQQNVSSAHLDSSKTFQHRADVPLVA